MFYSILPESLAYLDPGSGSLILQLIIAAFLGLGVLARSQWKKIKSLFGYKEPPKEEDENDDAGQEQ